MDIDAMERWNSLTPMEMSILRAIKRRIDEGDEKIPIRDVAADAYTSTTSVMRLAKKLGYPGFSAMLFDLRSEIVSMGGGSEVPDLQMFATSDSPQQVDNLVDVLARRTLARIHLIGTGYSGYVAGYFCQRLQELGMFATEKSPLDFRDDVPMLVVFVSESGETDDLLFIQERCHMKHVEGIVFSANVNSTLCSRAHSRIVIERRHSHGVSGADYFVSNCLFVIEDIVQRLWKIRDDQEES